MSYESTLVSLSVSNLLKQRISSLEKLQFSYCIAISQNFSKNLPYRILIEKLEKQLVLRRF